MRFVLAVILAFALAAGIFAQGGSESKKSDTSMISEDASGKMSADASASGGAMAPAMKAEPKMGNQPVMFTTLEDARMLAVQGPTVLFFAADWGPTSQTDMKDIEANGGRLKNTTVVVLDYDKTAELKIKYGVTVQDTFVQIDAAGNKLAVWNGGGVDGIIAHVVKDGMQKDTMQKEGM